MGEFSKLHVWRKAHALALNVYRVAGGIRGARHGPLRTQMIRAALSIPTNIVEGRGQSTDKEFCRFLRIALNSSSELEYHFVVARDIQAIRLNDFQSLFDQLIEVRKMLSGLIRTLSDPQRPRVSPRESVPTS